MSATPAPLTPTRHEAPHGEIGVISIDRAEDILFLEEEIRRLLGATRGAVPACMRSQGYISAKLRLMQVVAEPADRPYASDIVVMDQGLRLFIEQVRDETTVTLRWSYCTYPSQFEWRRLGQIREERGGSPMTASSAGSAE